MSKKENGVKTVFLIICGVGFLILGITLVLVWWEDVVGLFKGAIGMALAVLGLIILYLIKK